MLSKLCYLNCVIQNLRAKYVSVVYCGRNDNLKSAGRKDNLKSTNELPRKI